MVVKRIFNGKFAHYYENVINRISSPLYTDRWRRSLVDKVVELLPNAKTVIDCCSGAGNVGKLFLKKNPGVKLLNCDISKPLLKMAKERLKEKAFYVCSDNRFYPIKSNSVDVIFSSFCVRNSPDPLLTIGESFRVLKRGGLLAVLDFFRNDSLSPVYLINSALFRSFMEANKLVSKEAKEAIEYLFESIERFFTKEEFLEILRGTGFTPLHVKDFMGGIATTIVAVKEVKNV
ncbi:class I SAM-dependent methyltransferase [Thermovibrio ammonificans]|jgi:ubiquinone/menaquinone biosynthesis methyltransferase